MMKRRYCFNVILMIVFEMALLNLLLLTHRCLRQIPVAVVRGEEQSKSTAQISTRLVCLHSHIGIIHQFPWAKSACIDTTNNCYRQIHTLAILIVFPTGSAEEIVLPFTKTLDSWKEYELDEVYKRTPQRPHFRPLFYSRQIFREWVASSLTGAFIHLLKKVDDDLGEDAPRSELDDYKEAIDLLEEHGFDVKAPLSRINELLSVKNGLPNILEEQKGMEKEMTVECSKEPKLNKSLVRCRSFFEDKGTAN